MRLKSDYYDYYDLAFSHGYTDRVFVRRGGNTGPPKREQFRILEAAGFKTPPHGTIAEVADEYWEAEGRRIKSVVVYDDEMAHCAEGKRLVHGWTLRSNPHMGMPGGDRFYYERQKYCSAFVGEYPPAPGSVGWRRLQIGPHVFWVEYRSETSWMSNMDTTRCEVIGVEMNAGFHPHIRRPLFAVDFVIGRELYAVDLNYGPGVRGSGVENLLPALDAVRAITSWFDAHGDVDGEN